MKAGRLLLVLMSLQLACASDDARDERASDPEPKSDGGAQQDPNAEIAYLSPTQHLVRASMALRGLRPSLQELEAVREDPRYVPAIVDWYLKQPELGPVIREMHEEAWQLGVDKVIDPAGFPSLPPLSKYGTQRLNESIVDAPLRLVEHVVLEDRPYTEIVTARYTYADEIVAGVWGMPYDEQGETWQETHYADDRPESGLLSDAFLWNRHSTTFSNKGRGRANTVTRALLCYDFLAKELPIDTSIDFADPDAVTNAVQNNPTCAACHVTLDPLAAFFAPLSPASPSYEIAKYPHDTYDPLLTKYLRVTEPGYFGEPGNDVRALGRFIAEDPRFATCTAKRFYSFLTQTDLDQVPDAVSARFEKVLVDSGMSAKALLRAIVLSDEFRASHATDEASDETADALVGLRKASPRAFARMIQGLTGYRWQTTLPLAINGAYQVGDVDLMTDSFFGFKVLAGGTDGASVARSSHTMSATVTLSFEALSARAAKHVVEQDFAKSDKQARRLLRDIDESDTSEAAVRRQLAALSLRFYGDVAASDAPAIDDAYTLFRGALALGDARRAWTITLNALLQDPRMAFY